MVFLLQLFSFPLDKLYMVRKCPVKNVRLKLYCNDDNCCPSFVASFHGRMKQVIEQILFMPAQENIGQTVREFDKW